MSYDDDYTPHDLPGRRNADDDIQLLSVTAAIGVLDKPALVYWAANAVADAVIVNLMEAMEVGSTTLEELREEAGLEEGVRTPARMRDAAEAAAWRALAQFTVPLRKGKLKDVRRTLSESRYDPDIDETTGVPYQFGATATGSMLHNIYDDWLLNQVRPPAPHPELVPYMDQFDAWLQKFQPEAVMAEATGINLDKGYAGRLDLCAYIDFLDWGRKLCMLDYKTSRNSWRMQSGRAVPSEPYAEGALQLTAYSTFSKVVRWDQAPRLEGQTRDGKRYYYIEPDELLVAQPMPKVEAGYIIHVTPEHCHPHPVIITDWMRDTWLYILEVARRVDSAPWKAMIGPAAGPPHLPDLRMPGGRDEGESELVSRLVDSLPTAPQLSLLEGGDDTDQGDQPA